MNKKTKKLIKILISITGGIYGTALMYSFIYSVATFNFTSLKILGTPALVSLIGSAVYICLGGSNE